jgi:hypothetical protein
MKAKACSGIVGVKQTRPTQVRNSKKRQHILLLHLSLLKGDLMAVVSGNGRREASPNELFTMMTGDDGKSCKL